MYEGGHKRKMCCIFGRFQKQLYFVLEVVLVLYTWTRVKRMSF